MSFDADEEAFLDEVTQMMGREPCYVVVGRSVPASFAARLAELGAEIVEDDRAEGVHLVAGATVEWETLTRA